MERYHPTSPAATNCILVTICYVVALVVNALIAVGGFAGQGCNLLLVPPMIHAQLLWPDLKGVQPHANIYPMHIPSPEHQDAIEDKVTTF